MDFLRLTSRLTPLMRIRTRMKGETELNGRMVSTLLRIREVLGSLHILAEEFCGFPQSLQVTTSSFDILYNTSLINNAAIQRSIV
jgi:hypothetical protein